MRGWYSESYNRLQACTELEYRASVRRPTAFGWVLFKSNTNLIPLGAECPSAVLAHQGLTAWITVTLPRREGEDRVIMKLGNAREIQLDSDMGVEGPCAVFATGGPRDRASLAVRRRRVLLRADERRSV